MRFRKYAGLLLGSTLALAFAASALADTIGPNQITNKSPGWNSPIWQDNTPFTDFFDIWSCSSSDTSLKFDLMHHWFGLPSTGTAEKTLTCANNTTVRSTHWSNVANADYSIEYTHNNVATITLTYRIIY